MLQLFVFKKLHPERNNIRKFAAKQIFKTFRSPETVRDEWVCSKFDSRSKYRRETLIYRQNLTLSCSKDFFFCNWTFRSPTQIFIGRQTDQVTHGAVMRPTNVMNMGIEPNTLVLETLGALTNWSSPSTGVDFDSL